jgi:hypothetical protein
MQVSARLGQESGDTEMRATEESMEVKWEVGKAGILIQTKAPLVRRCQQSATSICGEEMIDKRKDVDAELAELRLSIERLTNGLRQSIETQATQTVMLQAILDAATAPLESEQDLTNACAQILATLKDQTNLFTEIHRALTEPATAAK